jgi:hypothetical protein
MAKNFRNITKKPASMDDFLDMDNQGQDQKGQKRKAISLKTTPMIQKNWRFPVDLAERLEAYIQQRKAETGLKSETKVMIELLDNFLKRKGF